MLINAMLTGALVFSVILNAKFQVYCKCHRVSIRLRNGCFFYFRIFNVDFKIFEIKNECRNRG